VNQDEGPADDPALLLVQLGAHAAARFAERLSALGLEPRHAGVLRSLAALEGRSQQHIGDVLRIAPSRMVALVDDLDRRGLVERRRNDADRRAYALHLTTDGRRLLDQLRQLAADHATEMFAGLTPDQRDQLTSLLRLVAASHGIAAGSLPRPPRALKEPQRQRPAAHAGRDDQ